MARKKFDEDDDDFEDFDESLLDDEPNETNLESALMPRDYSTRKILLLEVDTPHRQVTFDVLQNLLTGAHVRAVSNPDEALKVMFEDEWDTYVVDLQEPGVSNSMFVKKVNNQVDAMLVALSFGVLTAGDEHNRLKLEPMRRLFDVEKPSKPKAQ